MPKLQEAVSEAEVPLSVEGLIPAVRTVIRLAQQAEIAEEASMDANAAVQRLLEAHDTDRLVAIGVFRPEELNEELLDFWRRPSVAAHLNGYIAPILRERADSAETELARRVRQELFGHIVFARAIDSDTRPISKITSVPLRSRKVEQLSRASAGIQSIDPRSGELFLRPDVRHRDRGAVRFRNYTVPLVDSMNQPMVTLLDTGKNRSS